MSARTRFSLIVPLMRILLTLGLLLTATAGQAIERVTYYHNDALGSPVAATDQNGTLLWRESYAPYGERLTKEASGKDTVWYTGKQEEAAFGLNYFGARWYDPRIGRFMGVDPAGFEASNFQSFNRYAYANNNPYAYVDPDGRDAIGIVFKGYMVDTGYGFKAPFGHAGVVLLDNKTGLTKYYDYGRYDPNNRFVIGEKLATQEGNIRNIEIPNAVIGDNGKPTADSLKIIYDSLSKNAGHDYPVAADYHEGADFKKMDSYVNNLANDRNRKKYLFPSYTCYQFKNHVIDSGK